MGRDEVGLDLLVRRSAIISRDALYRYELRGEAPMTSQPDTAGAVRPKWGAIYLNVAHTSDRDDELLVVTRETLRLASYALRKQNAEDYYHNYGAAEQEVLSVLASDNAAGEWRPIATAPKDGTTVLLFIGREIGPGYWHTGRWAINPPHYWNNPSHWMPLPAAPN